MAISSCAQKPIPGSYQKAAEVSPEVRSAAEFAVKAQSKAEKSQIQLLSIDKAEQQVVAGMNYKLDLKVQKAGKKANAEAVVWHQAWNQKSPYQLTSWNWK